MILNTAERFNNATSNMAAMSIQRVIAASTSNCLWLQHILPHKDWTGQCLQKQHDCCPVFSLSVRFYASTLAWIIDGISSSVRRLNHVWLSGVKFRLAQSSAASPRNHHMSLQSCLTERCPPPSLELRWSRANVITILWAGAASCPSSGPIKHSDEPRCNPVSSN